VDILGEFTPYGTATGTATIGEQDTGKITITQN
jgi:hypothetical protein